MLCEDDCSDEAALTSNVSNATIVSDGVDISFPMHNPSVSENYAWLPHNTDPANNPTPKEFVGVPIQPLGNKKEFHKNFLDGCWEKYPGACDSEERQRISMNLRQPQSMQNYTEVGFKKIRAPDDVFNLIKEFWEKINTYKPLKIGLVGTSTPITGRHPLTCYRSKIQFYRERVPNSDSAFGI